MALLMAAARCPSDLGSDLHRISHTSPARLCTVSISNRTAPLVFASFRNSTIWTFMVIQLRPRNSTTRLLGIPCGLRVALEPKSMVSPAIPAPQSILDSLLSDRGHRTRRAAASHHPPSSTGIVTWSGEWSYRMKSLGRRHTNVLVIG